ncbi:MAG TPA: efflux transporter outer membrane subunit [Thermoanaerobaculia bacterium]|nr:efflux transporter outer membrane subunit [Thermoanaerobaculia bacterium]
MNRAVRIAAAGVLVIGCSRCTVGPDYKRPESTAPPEYRGLPPKQGVPPEAASFGDETWWDAFQDETLRDLIRTALKDNYDVRIAAVRILEAGAQLGITRADQLPSVAAEASGTKSQTADSHLGPGFKSSTLTVGLSLAWELDFWGKFRRATESARANLLSQEWARRQVISSLVSDVADAYFGLRELDHELEISRNTLASRRDSLRLTQLLEERGAISMLDVRQAEQLVFTAGAAIPDLERRIEQQENLISFLLGENPRAIGRGRSLIDQPHALEVPAGLPSSLLERRPDIRQAEEQLVAANAQIGVARANYFPQIALTASGGYQSSALNALFTGPAAFWSLGAGLLQPVFEGGRIRSGVSLAEARAEEAMWTYRRTVLQAFRDVADALVGYRKSQEFRAQLEQLANSAEEATKLSNMRYRGGSTSYLEVLDSEERSFSAQLSLAQAQLRELESLVQIYRALGGGWELPQGEGGENSQESR